MAVTVADKPQRMAAPVPKPEWAPRFWEGCNLFAWLRLLARNRFAFSPRYLYIVIIVTVVSALHSLLHLVQQVVYGRRVRRTKFRQPPIFILGHWRTGTTFLHELLIQDDRHGYPTTYECLAPNDFLLTERLFTRLLWFLMPKHRLVDNMPAGFDRPQEDEFALCMLGEGSPYLTIAFPNRGLQQPDYLDLEQLPPRLLRRWKKTFYRFLQQVTYKNGKRLVLKSPPHTCRIKVLQEMFPNALFVHIVRNPYAVFPSTVHLWRTLYRQHGLQKPTFAGLEEQVFTTGLRLYDKLEETRGSIDPARFYELRYEELVKNPLREIEAMYTALGLDGFDEHMQPQLEGYLRAMSGYETNRYQLTEQQRAEIGRRWGRIIERYGYAETGACGERKPPLTERKPMGNGTHREQQASPQRQL
jgi:hypothetical protein